ncbi:non-ribosomal peptide synthetase [Micromonospora sp. CNB394]|uniref:non-ribosomal peptide synthetase n=1 Tax=Micromonospora sp. CNB394 TaxID=1169151 RepID=UPI000377A080|nr:non-ribosomal peptide synthetase [Micromonospora sp. CNB394]
MDLDSETLTRISALSPRKQALLAERLRRPVGTEHAPIGRRPDGPVPLSFAQQRLWFLDQLDPGTAHYNIPLAATIRGPIDVPVLERSLNVLVERHESLRTSFVLGDDGPVQIVHERTWVPLEGHDLADLPEPDRSAALDDLVVKHANRPFALDRAPLLRVGLVRLGPAEHVLMASIHHIIADTWSMELVLRELSVTYEALTHGQRPPLDDLAVQYPDYAYWQRSALQGEALDAQVAYWRDQLAGEVPVLDLPTDRARPAQQSYRGAQYVEWLPADLAERARELGREARTGTFSVFLAGLAALLGRYSGQDRVGIGTPVANRGRPELTGMVGYLSNTVLLRTDLRDDPTFTELLARAHRTNLGALANQDLPFDRIVEIAQPDRDLSRTPLIQVMFVFRAGDGPEPGAPAVLPGLDEALAIDNHTAKFDLTFGLEENGGTFRLAVEYSTDLFDEATVVRMVGHLTTLLTAALADPTLRLADLPLLTAPEEEQLVVEWNRTDTAYPSDRCLHELIEEQVDRDPEALAVVTGTGRLTYAELDARANQLAHHLIARGAGPDVPVGICLEKSLDLVVGLLGIAKAGSAYLPLDPTYPAERLRYMLDAAAAPLVVGTAASAPWAASVPGVRLVDVEADRAAVAAEPNRRPRPAVTPENLAYVIFTSGSTGRPKGVLLDHRGRVNNFSDFNRRLGIGPGDRLLGLAATGFDMSAYDVFGTLMAGATLALPDPGTERDPEHWHRVVAEHRVTVWHTVPALLEMFVEAGESVGAGPLPIRLALLGGDWIPLSLPDRLRALAPGVRVVSLGGATEVSMDSTIYLVDEVDPTWRSIPYGRPMANQRCFVLDSRMRPVPVGVPGDLYLAGVGVGRGYLGDTELTRAKFLPSPLPQWPDERLYRTGDRARYRSDGNLELLGRSDFQVKIRGWRIEPGEVESALRAQDGVKEALVTVSPDDGTPRRLIAYLVAEPGGSLDPAVVRAAAQEILPDYLVPAVLMPLESFPLTPNGKIDRGRLPAPDAGGEAAGTPYVAPRDRTEQVLADIWSELLGLDRVGIEDNFFALGGDSITTIQVVSRARRVGVSLSPRQMFQHQTIAELARDASTVSDEEPGAPDELPPLTAPTPAELARLRAEIPDLVDVYPLPPMQRHMLRRQLAHPRPGQYVIQADYLFVRDGLDLDALTEAWQYVVRRHPTLRTSFHWAGLAEPVQVVHADATIRISRHDLRGLDTAGQVARQDEIVDADRAAGFDLGAAPLLRLHLLQIDDGTYKYVCTNHHIVLDGWSRAIVQQEVFAVYQAILDGETPRLPTLTPFRDYVAWLRGRDLDTAARFWRDHLAGFDGPTPVVAAVGRPDPVVGTEFAKQRIPLDPVTHEALAEYCRVHRLTVNTVIQGAWLLLMAAYTGRRDVVLGVTSSGRATEFPGVDTVSGLCMNTLPVRVTVDPDRKAREWLADLQADQVELRQYEYSSVEEALGVELLDLFECMMVFENYPWDGSLNNLASRVDLEHPLAQADYQVAQFEFPLRVEVVPGADTLLIMHYYPGVFDHDTVTAMIADWDATIAGLAARGDGPLGGVAVTTARRGAGR